MDRRRRFWALIESGAEDPSDPQVAVLLAEQRSAISALDASERSLLAQLATGRSRVDDIAVERFAQLIRERVKAGDSALHKAYTRLFVADVKVSNAEIRIAGTRAALEAALVHGDKAGTPVVPSFDREWCRLQDSNLRPHHYE